MIDDEPYEVPCPECPDGNEWGMDGPTGRACKRCKGFAFLTLGGVPEEVQSYDEAPF